MVLLVVIGLLFLVGQIPSVSVSLFKETMLCKSTLFEKSKTYRLKKYFYIDFKKNIWATYTEA